MGVESGSLTLTWPHCRDVSCRRAAGFYSVVLRKTQSRRFDPFDVDLLFEVP